MQNINKFTEVYIFVPSITIRRKLPYMESRVKEIDYLKCIFITLMIIFHLVYIGDKYPYAKQIVYTFHMSAFLIISGYLANNRKDARSFLRKLLWIFIPYACMEAAYTVMSHFLPVRESVDAITPTVLLDKIFLHPMGPYWYLHTLILCSLIYYITFRYVRLSVVSRLVESISEPTLTTPLLPMAMPCGFRMKTLPPILPFLIEFRMPSMLVLPSRTRLIRLSVEPGR